MYRKYSLDDMIANKMQLIKDLHKYMYTHMPKVYFISLKTFHLFYLGVFHQICHCIFFLFTYIEIIFDTSFEKFGIKHILAVCYISFSVFKAKNSYFRLKNYFSKFFD